MSLMKPITGQYECLHRSGVGLDYFTSRIDRITLQQNGHFDFIIQDRSRVAHAAQSILSGQQVTAAAQETKRQGTYTLQGTTLTLQFDDGTVQQGQLSWNGEGFQLGQDFFAKVSDSTLLPPTHRLKKDMDDIAKGLKIAGTIGGMAIKAAKVVHDTIQTTQEESANQGGIPGNQNPQAQPPNPPRVQPQPSTPPPVQATQNSPVANATNDPQATPGTVFCDQCGAPVRPGKRFCSKCGAQVV